MGLGKGTKVIMLAIANNGDIVAIPTCYFDYGAWYIKREHLI